MEIERKFLVAQIPDLSTNCRALTIRQGYVSTSPVIRLRQQDEDYILTVKGAGTLAKEEFELPLTPEQFHTLWQKTEGFTITKTRYVIPLADGLYAELDEYHDMLEGFLTVEVEFPSVETAHAFVPPDWFGMDVTENRRYSNASLSRYGRPTESL